MYWSLELVGESGELVPSLCTEPVLPSPQSARIWITWLHWSNRYEPPLPYIFGLNWTFELFFLGSVFKRRLCLRLIDRLADIRRPSSALATLFIDLFKHFYDTASMHSTGVGHCSILFQSQKVKVCVCPYTMLLSALFGSLRSFHLSALSIRSLWAITLSWRHLFSRLLRCRLPKCFGFMSLTSCAANCDPTLFLHTLFSAHERLAPHSQPSLHPLPS